MTDRQTGYPSVDKPWLKYYDPELASESLPELSIYQYMRVNASQNLKRPAFTLYGKTIRYDQFLNNIDDAAKALSFLGVKENDRILFLMPNIPETAELLYGANKIGAIPDFIDPRPDSADLTVSARKVLHMAIAEKTRYIVALDLCYLAMIAPIEKEFLAAGIKDVIAISLSSVMTPSQQLYYLWEYIAFNGIGSLSRNLRTKSQQKKAVQDSINETSMNLHLYNALKIKAAGTVVHEVPFEPHRVTAITHSSGTSGNLPKAVPLENEGINSYAFQLVRSNVNIGVGDRYLHILPYFSAYGLGLAHAGFSCADNMIEFPEFQPKDIGRYILKYKPQIVMGTPSWFGSFLSDPTLVKSNLSFLRTLGYGGDSMNPDLETEINKFLANHGSKIKLTKGHGMSETSGGASYAIDEYNLPGSMGIPMIDTIYGVVDPDTKELIRFNDGDKTIQGELIISSPAVVRESFDGKIVCRHGTYHGLDYVFTGDLGTMDRNGILYFLSRDDRTFTRYDGYKIKSYQIENEIKKHPKVKECIISAYYDERHNGKMPVAFIVPKDSCNTRNDEVSLAKEIIEKCFTHNPDIPSRNLPGKMVFKNSLPMTINGKLDYKILEASPLPDDTVSIDFEETTMELGEINIH